MLTGLFFIIVVTGLALHYFLNERVPRGVDQSGVPVPQAIPLAETVENLPDSIFLQDSFTWTRPRKNGEIFLGLHPMITSLLGVSHSLELLSDDAEIKRGGPLLRIRQGNRQLQVFSPVDGLIVEANTDYRPQPGWTGTTMRGGIWVYRIEPGNLEEERSLWLSGEDASTWAYSRYRAIRDFLQEADQHHEVGLAAADGGEMPAGVLSEMDDPVWEAFQDSFLRPPEPHGAQ